MSNKIRQRVTIISNNKVDVKLGENLYISRGKWNLPKGLYQRQDRFIIPVEYYKDVIDTSALKKLEEFALHWGAYNNTIIQKQVEAETPELKNLNNALAKFIEPGYSLYSKGHTKELVEFLNANSINHESVDAGNFIETAVSSNFFSTSISDSLDKSTAALVAKLACLQEDEHREECTSNYSELLAKASSISIEYNNKLIPGRSKEHDDNQLIITVFWNTGTLNEIGSTIYKSDNYKRELGFFEIDHRASQLNDLNLYGLSAELPTYLVPDPLDGSEITDEYREKSLADDDEVRVAQKTMFFIKPRHLTLSDKLIFNSSFQDPIGLHPVHKVSLKTDESVGTSDGKLSLLPPMNKKLFDCELFSYYRLPNSLFVDKNEYSKTSPVQLVGVWGETDLESPSYKTDKWGSNALFKIKVDTREDGVSVDEVAGNYLDLYQVKLHSRYQTPKGSNLTLEHLPKPDIFWACDLSISKLNDARNKNLIKKSDMEDMKSSFDEELIFKNPLDMKSKLNMDGIFTDDTSFYHYIPETKSIKSGELFQDYYTIPNAKTGDYTTVQALTAGIVLISFVYLLQKVFTRKQPVVVPSKKEK